MNKVVKDQWNVKLKYPDRSCKECAKYPCFEGIENTVSNFSQYGCIYYKSRNEVNGKVI